MNDFMKDVEGILNTTVKQFEEGVNKLGSKLDLEAKKLELKSQIGNHERVIRQHYTKLGEIYFNSLIGNETSEESNTIVEVIKSNKKVVELLNIQLKDLEK